MSFFQNCDFFSILEKTQIDFRDSVCRKSSVSTTLFFQYGYRTTYSGGAIETQIRNICLAKEKIAERGEKM
jgi:hypothetical protein